MRILKIAARRAVILLALQLLWVDACYADDPGSPQFKEEVSRQAEIYQSRGDDVPEGYVITRSLLSYGILLPAEFNRSLADLGPSDRWLDIGAGEGRAILDYCTAKYDAIHMQGRSRREKKARAVAMSIEDRRTTYWHQTAASLEAGQIRYLFGKTLREYSPQELGQFRIITDVLGGFSYAQRLAVFMERVLSLLEVNGNFYTLLQDVRDESGTIRPHYPDSPFLTEITNTDGSPVSVCSWLKGISCVHVTCEPRTDSTPPSEVYRVRKVCSDVSVPALALVHFEAGTPPARRFQLRGSSPLQLGSTRR